MNLSNNETKRLARLQRRADHLKARIETNSGKDLSFDKAERSALLWAIKKITES